MNEKGNKTVADLPKGALFIVTTPGWGFNNLTRLYKKISATCNGCAKFLVGKHWQICGLVREDDEVVEINTTNSPKTSVKENA